MADDSQKISLIMALRRQGIQDSDILGAMERVPRDLFVPESFQAHAYDNNALPIDCGQTISQPYIVALMTQALDLNDRCKVLEIGTGSGYQAAILSHLCRRVYTIERYRTLHGQAQTRFDELGLTNVTAMVGDGTKGWADQAPFDRIIVTAAAPEIPENLITQLKIGGKLVIPVDNGPDVQELVTISRHDDGVERRALIPVRFVPLVEGVAKEL